MKGSHKQMKEHIQKSIDYLETLKSNSFNENIIKSCDTTIEKYKMTMKELDEIFSYNKGANNENQ